jgi:hypothetical protein
LPIRFVGSAAASFAVTTAVVATVAGWLLQNQGSPRSGSDVRVGYALSVTIDGSKPRVVTVNGDGKGCEVLDRSAYLRETCVLATHTSGPYIAAAGLGRMNSEHVPAVEALIWRAWLAHKPSVCGDGGLLEPSRSKCEADAREVGHSYRDGPVYLSLLGQ